MKNPFSIPGMTVVRTGVALCYVWTGVSQLIFAAYWATFLPSELFQNLYFDAITLFHVTGAIQLVFGAALFVGLFSRISGSVLFLYQIAAMLFINPQDFTVTSLILPLSLFAILVNGSDEISVDRLYVYYTSPFRPVVPPPLSLKPFGSMSLPNEIPRSAVHPEPSFADALNVLLFGVIGALLLIIVGYATVFVRTTPVLYSAVSIVMQPKISQLAQTVSAQVQISSSASVPAATKATVKPVTVPVKPTTVTGYTLTQVAEHKSAASCYSVVEGNVYDLTPWISQHPGGSGNILGMCGIDATDAFTGKHGGQARPASELAGFKIGPLKK